MQIKPPASTQTATAHPPSRTPATPAKSGDFAQLLKTAQADTASEPAAGAATPVKG